MAMPVRAAIRQDSQDRSSYLRLSLTSKPIVTMRQ
jgi:hypothetical protein